MRCRRTTSLSWLLVVGLLAASACAPGEEVDHTPKARDAGVVSDDAGTVRDAGSSDAGPSDAGSSDAGPSDAGPSDAGSSDGGSEEDGGSVDGGHDSDGGVLEAPPEVEDASPAYGATEVSLVAVVELTFSASMDAALTEAAFSLEAADGALVAGTFEWLDGERKLVFTPGAALLPGTTYTFAVDVGATSAEGVPLDEPFESYFVTVSDETSLDAVWGNFTWNVDLWQ